MFKWKWMNQIKKRMIPGKKEAKDKYRGAFRIDQKRFKSPDAKIYFNFKTQTLELDLETRI